MENVNASPILCASEWCAMQVGHLHLDVKNDFENLDCRLFRGASFWVVFFSFGSGGLVSGWNCHCRFVAVIECLCFADMAWPGTFRQCVQAVSPEEGSLPETLFS